MSEHSNFTVEDRVVLATLSKEMQEVKNELREIKTDITGNLSDLKDLVVLLQSLATNMNDKIIKHDKDIDDMKKAITNIDLQIVEINFSKKIVFYVVSIVGTAVILAIIGLVIVNK